MPVRIRWISKDYFGILLMFFGAIGLIQTVLIIIAQFFLIIASYYVVILIPFGAIITLTYGAIIIYESILQVQRRKQLKTQYRKSRAQKSVIIKILYFPIVFPIMITAAIFISFFIIAYSISITFLDVRIAFIISEIVGCIVVLLAANAIEIYYGKVRRY